MKLKEYNTNILDHTEVKSAHSTKSRTTNTFISNAFNTTPTSQVNKHQIIFAEKPLNHGVMRASYQDSNIFATQRLTDDVIQKTAQAAKKEARERVTDTFRSGGYRITKPDEVKGREQNTFISTVFGAAIQNKVNKTRLGGDSQGTETLFGSDQPEYTKSSQNEMIPHKPPAPITINHIPTNMLLAKELHGESAEKYGLQNNKRDGNLMA